MKVRFTATAFAEMTEIRDYIAKDNPAAAKAIVPAAAKAIVLRIEQVIAHIAQFPHIAREIDESSVRVFPVGPFPYLVFYTVDQGGVIVRNVRHGKRKRPSEG